MQLKKAKYGGFSYLTVVHELMKPALSFFLAFDTSIRNGFCLVNFTIYSNVLRIVIYCIKNRASLNYVLHINAGKIKLKVAGFNYISFLNLINQINYAIIIHFNQIPVLHMNHAGICFGLI